MKDRIAQLLIDIGLDSKDAERAAERLERKLLDTGKAGKKAGSDISKGEKDLDRWTKTAEVAEKASKILIAGLVGVGTVVFGLGHKVLETGATFESLRASLKTVTGSAGAAEDALGFIRTFTSKTPFQLEEVSKAFIKLKSYGLDPSERALTAYGDTASSMSKSLDDMIEAVADASSGEFERLKEFGIKASKQGEVVTFTFRGVRTEVENNSKAIQDYLVGLGEDNFAGAMGDQMTTLNGMVSNLKDALTEFFLAVAEMGPLEEFKGLIEDIKSASGDKDGLAKTLARTLVSAIRTLRRLIQGDMIGVLEKAAKVLQFVVENWDIFIGLLGAAKTLQAFSAVSTGLQAMGIAASGALGPIGLIMAALIALIPVANKAGQAIGDAISADRNRGGIRAEKRGGAQMLGDVAKYSPEAAAAISAKNEEVLELRRKFEKTNAKGSGLFSGNRTSVILAEERLQKAERELAGMQQRAAAKVEAGQKAERDKAAAEAQAAADEQAEFGDFDAKVALIEQELGMAGSDESEGTSWLDTSDPKKVAARDAAIAELAVSGDVKKARKAAGLDKKKGRGGGKKGKAAKPVTSPTTVSEFFSAAAHGDLGPIAAKTPSTKEIEPTVAVDITNNNYTFDISNTISGVTDPVEVGRQVTTQIEEHWKKKIGAAGQATRTNLKR